MISFDLLTTHFLENHEKRCNPPEGLLRHIYTGCLKRSLPKREGWLGPTL
jgi:hypothetical protein